MPKRALEDLGIRFGAENQGQDISHPLRGALTPRNQVVPPRSIHGEKFLSHDLPEECMIRNACRHPPVIALAYPLLESTWSPRQRMEGQTQPYI